MSEVYSILGGYSTNYLAVWADPTANIQSGSMYVSTTSSGAAFSVVNLEHNVLVDCYTTTLSGTYDEPLEDEDIIDINVSTLGG
jgi:hypothetical protein